MSSRLINPDQVFRDASGEVLSNGTLTFYVNGDVNTQKNIYSDIDLTTVQSNPYTLSAYGTVIGDVWLDGAYTVVEKDSDGNTVRTRNDIESISSTSGGGGETVQGSVQNKFVNGACRVASEGGSVSISGSYQEGQVAEIYVKAAGTPTNGTIDLTKYADCGTSGYTLHVNQLTTGGGGTVDYRFRFNSVDSRDLVSGAAIFQCNVLQNTGTAKTYTISIYKANAEDNFSATTLIGQSSGTSVLDSTDTKISYSIANMGACENGIEIVVSCACGAVTTKDFYMNDIVFRKGQAEIVFEQEPYAADYAHVKFAAQDSQIDTNTTNIATNTSAIATINSKKGQVIASGAITAAADLEFILSALDTTQSVYNRYRIDLINFLAQTDDVEFRATLSTDAGATDVTANYGYYVLGETLTGAARNIQSASAAHMLIAGDTGATEGLGNAAGENATVSIFIANMNTGASVRPFISIDSLYLEASGSTVVQIGKSTNTVAADYDAIKFYFESGNFTANGYYVVTKLAQP